MSVCSNGDGQGGGSSPPPPSSARFMVRAQVDRVSVDPLSGLPSLILLDESGRRSASIAIGVGEASAITAVLGEIQLERPVCHDLLKHVLVFGEIQLLRAEIDEILDGPYGRAVAATVVLRRNDGIEKRMPARPSDAIAMALRMGGEILISPRLLGPARPHGAADLPGLPRLQDLGDLDGLDGFPGFGPKRSGRWPRLPSSPIRRPRLKM